MKYLIIIILAIIVFFLIFYDKKKGKKAGLNLKQFENDWKAFLHKEVKFYRELDNDEKKGFENRVLHFLNTTRITGVQTSVNIYEKLLVAASAIIPIFSFPTWEYPNLYEVLLYQNAFNENYEMQQSDSTILGMVGTGVMEGKMILSKPSLIQGFRNDGDKKNVGIHEFIHLVDKADGVVDGVPSVLLEKQYAIPWIKLAKDNINRIRELHTDINPYGGVDEAEFFSVVSEYFFERPKLLKSKHPELYKALSEIFTIDLAKKYKNLKRDRKIMRNDPCICGSGKKFKHCCGKSGK